MSASSTSARAARRSPAAGGSLRVAIFYVDIAAADRALRSVREALRRQHDERVLQPMLWNVQLFQQEQWLRLAAADVAQAELCVISLGHERTVANSAQAWFRALAPRDSNKWITLAPFEAVGGDHEIIGLTG
jgi:hypothetical protein